MKMRPHRSLYRILSPLAALLLLSLLLAFTGCGYRQSVQIRDVTKPETVTMEIASDQSASVDRFFLHIRGELDGQAQISSVYLDLTQAVSGRFETQWRFLGRPGLATMNC